MLAYTSNKGEPKVGIRNLGGDLYAGISSDLIFNSKLEDNL